MGARQKQDALALLTSAAFLAAPAAFAQAWLPPKGEASVSMGYQYYDVKDHLTSDGQRFDDGKIWQQGLVVYLTYGITDRLTVGLGLPPYYETKYIGNDPHEWPVLDANGAIVRDQNGTPLFHPPTIDDGSYHGTFQNFGAALRFMALKDPLIVTPFVAAGVPSHGYETFGHTAVGRGLAEVRIGANVARRLDPILPDAYVQGGYAFAFREKAMGVRVNYSYADAELGYFVTPSVLLRVFGAWQIAHGGLVDEDYPPASLAAPTLREFFVALEGEQIWGRPALPIGLHHDQLEAQNTFNAGVGASFAAMPSLDVSAATFRTISGSGGHAAHLGISVWTSISFSPAKMFRKSSRKETPSLASALQ